MSADSGTAVPNATEASGIPVAAQRKPRLALFIATACGLGYIPVAPGTWGSLGGVALWVLSVFYFPHALGGTLFAWITSFPLTILLYALAIAIAIAGVWASDRAAKFARAKDPQFVVIDEVSGQYLALMLGIAFPTFDTVAKSRWLWLASGDSYFSVVNVSLKYLLLGFILFRVFDIWKPFPARQAESLPGGWGIMADDWVAGIYAAIGLWLARAAGL
jgi:phosphatidylglycerophosphatase A